MIYVWTCQTCGQDVEIHRRMKRAKIPPHRPCPTCESSDWKKGLSHYRETRSFASEDHNNPWPLRVPGLETVIHVDDLGNKEYEYKDVVFKSKAHQDEYLKRHNLVRIEDGRSPMVGESQHSVYSGKKNWRSTKPIKGGEWVDEDRAIEMARGL